MPSALPSRDPINVDPLARAPRTPAAPADTLTAIDARVGRLEREAERLRVAAEALLATPIVARPRRTIGWGIVVGGLLALLVWSAIAVVAGLALLNALALVRHDDGRSRPAGAVDGSDPGPPVRGDGRTTELEREPVRADTDPTSGAAP